VTARTTDDAHPDQVPVLEAGDLHEDDFAAVLADHLPARPTR
jgi:hypothetical protein